MPDQPARTGERIAKLLARAGVASRREVERMIAEGRVKIGDTVVETANTVLPGLKGVTVDGKPVRAVEAARLFGFHKPSGLLTAERDPAGRPTIYTALRNALPKDTPRLMPIGRLDLNTEGLLLLTNDGGLKRAMELPSSGVPRTYRARTFGDVSQAQLEDLIEGIEIDGVRYGQINANLERSTGRNQWIELTLTEGKNREVRRVLEHLGLQVSRLLRVAYGPFLLGDLPRGAAVEIRQVDVERFIKNFGKASDQIVRFGAPQTAKPRADGDRPARATDAKPRGRREAPARDGEAKPRGRKETLARDGDAKPRGRREHPARGSDSKPYGRKGNPARDGDAKARRPAKPGDTQTPENTGQKGAGDARKGPSGKPFAPRRQPGGQRRKPGPPRGPLK